MFLPMVKISYWNRPLPSVGCILRTPNKMINILKYRWTDVHDKRSNVENTRIQSIFRIPNETRLTRTFNPSGVGKNLYRFLRRTPRKWPMTTYVTRLYLIVVILLFVTTIWSAEDSRCRFIGFVFDLKPHEYVFIVIKLLRRRKTTRTMYNIQYRRGTYYNIGCCILYSKRSVRLISMTFAQNPFYSAWLFVFPVFGRPGLGPASAVCGTGVGVKNS